MSSGPVSPEFLDLAAQDTVIAEEKRRGIEDLGLQPGNRVLDVGCGVGHDLARLVPGVVPGGEVHGVDLRLAMLAGARRRLDGVDGPIALACAAATRLPYPSGCFDAVRSDRLLQHVAEPGPVLAEMARVLRSGGRLYLADTDWSTATLSCLPDPLLAKLRSFLLDRWVPQPRSGSQLLQLVLEAGLADARLRVSSIVSRVPSMAQFPGGDLGPLTEDDRAEIAHLAAEAAAAGHLVGSVTMFAVLATKP